MPAAYALPPMTAQKPNATSAPRVQRLMLGSPTSPAAPPLVTSDSRNRRTPPAGQRQRDHEERGGPIVPYPFSDPPRPRNNASRMTPSRDHDHRQASSQCLIGNRGRNRSHRVRLQWENGKS